MNQGFDWIGFFLLLGWASVIFFFGKYVGKKLMTKTRAKSPQLSGSKDMGFRLTAVKYHLALALPVVEAAESLAVKLGTREVPVPPGLEDELTALDRALGNYTEGCAGF